MKPSSAIALVSAMLGLAASAFSALEIGSFFAAQPTNKVPATAKARVLAINLCGMVFINIHAAAVFALCETSVVNFECSV